MNILHMKYAYEVAKAGSLGKAAESLVIAAPNLSRSIKELETELGITIFDRTSKGMTLTSDGEVFMNYARSILDQIDNLERVYKKPQPTKNKFSVSAPPSSYISQAFVNFSKEIQIDSVELFYCATNQQCILNNVLQQEHQLGIVRYCDSQDTYFKQLFEEKDLNYELIAEFKQCVIVNKNSSLCELDTVTEDVLKQYVKVCYKDKNNNAMDGNLKTDYPDEVNKIYVSERATRLELLSENKNTYILSFPMTKEILDKNNLVQIAYAGERDNYKDVLICKNNYKLTKIDECFITELCNSKRKIF